MNDLNSEQEYVKLHTYSFEMEKEYIYISWYSF
jgi:hypothetical protein